MMLFNPSWNKKPTGDWKSLDNLIAWLETKPEGEYYRYTNPTNCLLAQYLKAQGKRVSWIDSIAATFRESFFAWNRRVPLPVGFDAIAQYEEYNGRTFGGALKAAKQYRQSKLLENLLLAA